MRRLATLALAILAASAGAHPINPEGHAAALERARGDVVLRVDTRTDADLRTLEDLGAELWSCTARIGATDVRLPAEAVGELDRLGLAHETLIPDLGDHYERELDALVRAQAARGGAFYDNYHPLNEISDRIDLLVTTYPNLASRFTIGSSLGDDGVVGPTDDSREIFGIRITAPSGVSPKAQVVFNGCQHAREWVSVMVPLYIAEQMLENYATDPRVAAILDNVELNIIPVVNPDGYVHSWTSERYWRKNRRVNGDGTRGVDLNRNWSYEWGVSTGSSGAPSSDTFRGPTALSEPESTALANFLGSLPNLAAHVDFHAYSQLVLSPWGYTLDNPPDAAWLFATGQAMSDEIYSVHEEFYTAQPAAQLYVANGVLTDFVYGELDAPGWTIELRPADQFEGGFELPPSLIRPTCEENYAAMLYLSEWAQDPLFIRLLDAPTFAPPAQASAIRFQIDAVRADQPDPSMLNLRWRVGDSGAFATAPLLEVAPGEYEASVTPAACGQLEYYVEASTINGVAQTFPADAPAELLTSAVGEATTEVLDELESPSGWTVGAPGDTATTGIWERVDPIGTEAQPEDDHTVSGTLCWVTENGPATGGTVGTADVDNGATTLTSPAFDATAQDGEAYLTAWLWYSNDAGASPGQDTLSVLLSGDGGGSWEEALTLGATTDGWERYTLRIAEFVTPSSDVRLRVVARDDAPGSIVEAAIDDVELFFVGCDALAGDVNGDGAVDFTDLNILLSEFGDIGAGLQADLDGDGDVDFSDLNVVLSAFGSSA